jgi:plastocyanin
MGAAPAKMPRVVKAIALGLGAVVVLASGCGTSTGGGSGGGATAATPGPPAVSGPPVTVTIRNLAFQPGTVTVRVGQRVHWINNDNAGNDPVVHNVIAEGSQATFQSDNFAPGSGYTYTPTVPGTYPYTCSIHPDMMATLVVVK